MIGEAVRPRTPRRPTRPGRGGSRAQARREAPDLRTQARPPCPRRRRLVAAHRHLTGRAGPRRHPPSHPPQAGIRDRRGAWVPIRPASAGQRHELSADEQLLHKLGYAQELYRAMGGFGNFAISFTIISILAGCLTSYYIAFQNGGPVAVTWGWLLVGGFCTIVALAMAEIASSMPTAGGLYYWSSKLGSPGLGLVHGLVQPDRPDLRDRGDRLRRCDVRLVAVQPLVRHVADEGARVHRLHVRSSCSTSASISSA